MFKFCSGMVRLGFKISNKIFYYIGRLKVFAYFGWRPDLTMSYDVEIKYFNNIKIGNNVKIGPRSTLGALASITIGNNVTISKEVIIETAGLDYKNNEKRTHISSPITINDNCWIGARAIILAGVVIGCDTVVSAGSVVTKDVPSGVIVAGVPARIISNKNL